MSHLFEVEQYVIDQLADNGWARRTVIRNNDYEKPSVDTFFKKNDIVLYHFYGNDSIFHLGAQFNAVSASYNDFGNILVNYADLKVWAQKNHDGFCPKSFLPEPSDILNDKYKKFIVLNIDKLIIEIGGISIAHNVAHELKF